MKGVTSSDHPLQRATAVSIHTPNEGSDKMVSDPLASQFVSIHTPNEGSDQVVQS